MYCMGCNKQLSDDNQDMFMFKFEGKPPMVAHACNPDDLSKEKREKYKSFGNDEATSKFVINGKKFFGIVIE